MPNGSENLNYMWNHCPVPIGSLLNCWLLPERGYTEIYECPLVHLDWNIFLGLLWAQLYLLILINCDSLVDEIRRSINTWGTATWLDYHISQNINLIRSGTYLYQCSAMHSRDNTVWRTFCTNSRENIIRQDLCRIASVIPTLLQCEGKQLFPKLNLKEYVNKFLPK